MWAEHAHGILSCLGIGGPMDMDLVFVTVVVVAAAVDADMLILYERRSIVVVFLLLLFTCLFVLLPSPVCRSSNAQVGLAVHRWPRRLNTILVPPSALKPSRPPSACPGRQQCRCAASPGGNASSA